MNDPLAAASPLTIGTASAYVTATVTMVIVPAASLVTSKCASFNAFVQMPVSISAASATQAVVCDAAFTSATNPPTVDSVLTYWIIGVMAEGELALVFAIRSEVVTSAALSVPCRHLSLMSSRGPSMGTTHVEEFFVMEFGRRIPNPTTFTQSHSPVKVAPGKVHTPPGDVNLDDRRTVSLKRYAELVSNAVTRASDAATAVGSGSQARPMFRVLDSTRLADVATPGSVKYFDSSALLSCTMHICCDRNDRSVSDFVT